MKDLIISTKEQQLPAIVKVQLSSTSFIQTVKSEKSLELIKEAIIEIKKPLAVSATAREIQKAISDIFILLASPKGSKEDVSAELKTYIKYLAGQPLWAIGNAVEVICKEQTFRDFSKLFKEVKSQTDPIVKKINRLENIYNESQKEIEAEKKWKESIDNGESFMESLEKAAKQGNRFAIFYLSKNERKSNSKPLSNDKSCNTLGQDFLKKRNIVNKK